MSIDVPWCVEDFECWRLLNTRSCLRPILDECARKRYTLVVPPDFALPPGAEASTGRDGAGHGKSSSHVDDAQLTSFFRWHMLAPDRRYAGRFSSVTNPQAILRVDDGGSVVLEGPWPCPAELRGEDHAPFVIGNERRKMDGGGGGDEGTVQLLLLSAPLVKCGQAAVSLPQSLVAPFGRVGHNVQDAVEFLTNLDDESGAIVHGITLLANGLRYMAGVSAAGGGVQGLSTPPRRTSPSALSCDEGEERERFFKAVDALVETCLTTVSHKTSQRRTLSRRRLQAAVGLAVETLAHSLLFQRVFPLMSTMCQDDSQRLRRQVERLRRKGVTRQDLGADAALEAVDLRPARSALEMLSASTSPFEVVMSIRRFVDTVVACVPMPLQKYLNADSLVPLLQHTVVSSTVALETLMVHISYLTRFPSRLVQHLDSEGEYKIVSFRISVESLLVHDGGSPSP